MKKLVIILFLVVMIACAAAPVQEARAEEYLSIEEAFNELGFDRSKLEEGNYLYDKCGYRAEVYPYYFIFTYGNNEGYIIFSKFQPKVYIDYATLKVLKEGSSDNFLSSCLGLFFQNYVIGAGGDFKNSSIVLGNSGTFDLIYCNFPIDNFDVSDLSRLLSSDLNLDIGITPTPTPTPTPSPSPTLTPTPSPTPTVSPSPTVSPTPTISPTPVPMAVVPDITNKMKDEAVTLLEAAGLRLGYMKREYSDTIPKDTVISQDIAPGESVPEGSRIDIVLCSGPEPTPLPIPTDDYIDMTISVLGLFKEFPLNVFVVGSFLLIAVDLYIQNKRSV